MAYNVLIVDDSPAMRWFVRRVLTMSGLDVGIWFEAGDGQQGLSILENEWIDIVLTDINMPVMDGEQFVQRMHANESLRAIPVLVISADSTEARIQQMLSFGAVGYVAKPFRPEDLRKQIELILGVVHECA